MNLFCPVSESPSIAPFIFIVVFAPCIRKLLTYDSDNDAAAATADPTFIWGDANLCASIQFPIVSSSHSFCQYFNLLYGRVTTVMTIFAALVSSFCPFTQLYIRHSRIGRTSRFTSLSFGSDHDFIIMCNSYEVFPSPQKIGPRIEGSMTTIGTDVVVFSMSFTVSSLKNFPLWFGLL